jgi:signal transduction histidine kinase
VLSFGSVARIAGDGHASLPLVVGGVALAGFAAWLLFTLIGLLYRFAFPVDGVPRGIAFILLFGLIESTRAVVLALFLTEFGLASNINWPFEVLGGFMTGMALFSTVSIFIGDSDQYRHELQGLLEARERLRLVLEKLSKDLADRRAELLSSVREIIAGAAAKLIAQRDSHSPVDAKLVASLNQISADVVRPLSHSMYGQDVLDADISRALVVPKVRFNRVAVLSTLDSPFRPAGTAILIILLSAPAAFLRLGFVPGLLTMLGVFGLAIGLLAFSKYLLLPRIRTLPFWGRVTVIPMLYATVAVSVLFLVTRYSGLEANFPIGLQALYFIILGVPILSVLAITPAIRLARAEVLEETEATVSELEWMTARLGGELWADRRAIAKSLHQDVQGVLVAAAYRLQQAIDRGEDTTAATEEVYEIVKLAATFVVAPQEPPSMAHALSQLTERWEGILEISYSADAESELALAKDRIARQLLQETLSEFAINSVKHGLASHAHASVTQKNSRLLAVAITNDGAPLSDDASFEGLGSRMMASMGINARYENLASGGVALTAHIPIDPTGALG